MIFLIPIKFSLSQIYTHSRQGFSILVPTSLGKNIGDISSLRCYWYLLMRPCFKVLHRCWFNVKHCSPDVGLSSKNRFVFDVLEK